METKTTLKDPTTQNPQLTTFCDLVFRMRQAQSQYFRMRNNGNLKAAMDLEREVDAYILRYRNGDVPGVQMRMGMVGNME